MWHNVTGYSNRLQAFDEMTKKSSSVTIRDVARQAGVSVATVSRYINRNAPVSHEAAERLDNVMAELNYLPHAAARHLATRKTRIVGLLLTNMHNDFFAPLLSGIESVVSQHGYNLLVATHRIALNGDFQPPIGPHNTDGLLVFADSLKDEQLYQLHKKKFPVVLIHRTPPDDLPLPFVTVENKAATRAIIDHLIEVHGKRRIIFMRGPIHQEDSHWREMGYKASLQAHGIDYDLALVLAGEFEREVAQESMSAFLSSKHPEFDAVFAGDDEAAIGVFAALQQVGRRVPEEIAVAGFDDQRMSPFLNPPLTTVRAPTEEVGRIAGQQLFNLLQGLPVDLVSLLPTEIIIRRSCGCND